MYLNQAILIRSQMKIKSMKKSFFIYLFLLLSITSAAQEKLSLEQAIQVTLERNYDILLAKNDSLNVAVDREYAYALFLPVLNATGTKTWNKNDQKQLLANGEERGSPNIRSSNMQGAVALNWTLFDGMKMFVLRERYDQQNILAGYQLKNQITESLAQLIATYYDIVRQKQQLKATLELIDLNKERVVLAEKKVSVGLGSKPELLQARVDLNAQQSLLIQQRTLIEQLKETLNQIMRVDNNAQYDVYDSIPFNESLVLGDLHDDAERTNWSLAIARQNVQLAQLWVKENKADRYPTVTWNTAYNFSRTENQTVINNFTPLFNRNLGLNYGLSVNIPLFNKFTVRKNILRANYALTASELELERQRSLVHLALNNQFKNYQTSLQMLDLEEQNIQLAQENVQIAMARFKQGVTTNLELREAQKSLEDGYNRLIQARYNTKLAETELLKLKGDLIK
jgi:outer membrane protein